MKLPWGFNGYCANAPINVIDPIGLFSWWGVLDTALLPAEVLATFAAGAADSLTLDISRIVRNKMWGEETQINYRGVYVAGEYSEIAVEVSLTAGSALLKKAAAKKIVQVAASTAAKEMGEEITEAAARRAIQVATNRVTREIRLEARQITRATKDEVVHHINTLYGHPPYPGRGPVRSEFPTLGIRWFANSTGNLTTILKNDPGRHIWLHQRAYMAERAVVTLTHPALTGTRTLLNLNRDDVLDIDVDCKCKAQGH